jgi:hypothetical protein
VTSRSGWPLIASAEHSAIRAVTRQPRIMRAVLTAASPRNHTFLRKRPALGAGLFCFGRSRSNITGEMLAPPSPYPEHAALERSGSDPPAPFVRERHDAGPEQQQRARLRDGLSDDAVGRIRRARTGGELCVQHRIAIGVLRDQPGQHEVCGGVSEGRTEQPSFQ